MKSFTPIPKLTDQKPDETTIDYLRRMVGAFNFETDSYLQELPNLAAVFDFFQLWHTYDTDLLEGIVNAIEAGASPEAYNDFVQFYDLPWNQYVSGKWVEPGEKVAC